MHAVPLSPRTLALVTAVFGADDRARARTLLEEQCGANLPGLEGLDPLQLERFRYAVIRISEGRLAALDKAIALAKTDWRDLLMEADFGHDLRAHERWCSEVLRAAGSVP